MIYKSEDTERNAVMRIAELMSAAKVQIFAYAGELTKNEKKRKKDCG